MMIVNRRHHPLNVISLREMAAKRGLPYPVIVQKGLQIELDPHQDPSVFFRNIPSYSFTVADEIPFETLVEALAWEANEWEAMEAARFWRKRRLLMPTVDGRSPE